MLNLPQGISMKGIQELIDWFLKKVKQDQVTTILIILIIVLSSIVYGCIKKYNEDIVDCQEKVDNLSREFQNKIDSLHHRNESALKEQIRRFLVEKDKMDAYKRETDKLLLDYQKVYIDKISNKTH